MNETTLLLRLAGPTQAWDVRRRRVSPQRGWPVRAAARPLELLWPTHSGLVGLLGAAMGWPRDHQTPDLTVHVRVDQEGRARTEFRTSRKRLAGGRLVSDPVAEGVLDDAAHVAAVTGDAGLVDEIAQALARPSYPLCLGRREYPITHPLILQVTDQDPETALRAHPWIAAGWHRAKAPAPTTRLPLYQALPLPRHHHPVRRLDPVEVDNPDGRRDTSPDWFATIAGG